MKDHVEIGHLTKYDTFRVYGSKSIQTSLILRKRPPKNNFFVSFVTTVKSWQAPST